MTTTELVRYTSETKRSALKPTVPNAQQLRLWTETRAAFLWSCPAFSHVLYTMMAKAGGDHIAYFSSDVPIAATDGVSVIINPETFFKMPLAERVFVLAHEVLHGVWDHLGQAHRLSKAGEIRYPDGKRVPYKHDTMNRATDLVINAALKEAGVGSFPKVGLYDPKITGSDSALDVYRKVYKDDDGQGGGGGGGFDVHLAPPDAQDDPRSDAEWKQAVAAGMAAAKAQGKLPASLQRLFGDMLEPEVDWTEKVVGFFARKVGSGSSDWKRPDRRMITRDDPVIAPGRTGHGAGAIVVAVDTSGSIAADPGIIDRFFAELCGILEDVKPQRLIVMWCDAEVHRVDEVEDASDLMALRMQPVPGWGGTSFTPVFDEIASVSLEPDALIYLTDGDGSFPDAAPAYPVMWGDISQRADKYPFGEIVPIPLKSS